jgi:steroid 5-alpha reductase family enzyme
MAEEERKCSVSSATVASLFAMMLLLYDVMGAKVLDNKKSSDAGVEAWETVRLCHK